MNLEELDARMRAFEAGDDQRVPPGVFMVARLDGRGFSRLARDVLSFDDPYDERLRDAMVSTARTIMRSGFHILYGHTQSDELSLLFHPQSSDFGRRLRKLHSVLAGMASASFSLQVGTLAGFDCRVSQLPELSAVIDYFRWRARDAERNALNTRCQWAMRAAGASPQEISLALHGKTAKAKKKLLARQFQIDFNQLSAWRKSGVCLYWEACDVSMSDPLGGPPRTLSRQHIIADLELANREQYASLLRRRLEIELQPAGADTQS